MAGHCVYDRFCRDPPSIFFKGRMFCVDHARIIKANILKILEQKEKRENRTIPQSEEIGLNNPRLLKDNRTGRVRRIPGTHLVITKQEVQSLP